MSRPPERKSPSQYVDCPEWSGRGSWRQHTILCAYRCQVAGWGVDDCMEWLRSNWEWQEYFLYLRYVESEGVQTLLAIGGTNGEKEIEAGGGV